MAIVTNTYEYQVFDDGTFLGVWSDVISEPQFAEELNKPGVSMEIDLGRNEVDSTVAENLDVEVVIFGEGAPNGTEFFSGYISRVGRRYGGSNNIFVTLLSNGAELDNYEIFEETAEADVITQTSEDRTETMDPDESTGFSSFAQTVTPATSDAWSSIIFKLRAPSSPKGQTVVLSIYEGDIEGQSSSDLDPPERSVSRSLSNTAFEEITFSFEEFSPSVGQVYSLVLSLQSVVALGGGGGSFAPIDVRFHGTSSDTYADGKALQSPVSSSTYNEFSDASASNIDTYFKIIGTTRNTRVAFTSEAPEDIAKTILDRYNEKGGKIGYTSTSVETTGLSRDYTFNVNTTLEGLETVLDLSAFDWAWRVGLGDNTYYLFERSDTADHTFAVGREIENFEIVKSIEEVENVILLTGGETAGTNLFVRLSDSDSITDNRRGLKRITDTGITDSTTGIARAQAALDRGKDPKWFTSLTITAEKYDIETINVGDMVAVANTGDSEIDALLLQIQSRFYSPDKVTLQLSTLPPRVGDDIEKVSRGLAATNATANPDSPS